MFNPKSDKKVKELVELEYKQAVSQWGKVFPDEKTAAEVLEEECQEAHDEVSEIFKKFRRWMIVSEDSIKTIVPDIKKNAENGIKELAQVCAVCEKIMKSDI